MNEYTAEPGENIYSFVYRVQESMKSSTQNYAHIIFNDITIEISNNSNVNDICIIYNLKSEIARMKAHQY